MLLQITPQVKMKNKYLTTKDYSLFEYGELNREVNKINLKSKIKSIEKYGCLSPISVAKISGNDKLVIIDGQHRFLALVHLKQTIPYIVMNIDEKQFVDIMAEMNNNILKWKKMDFIQIHAKDGNETYKKILEFTDVYPDFGLTAYLNILSIGGTGDKCTRYWLEVGKMEVPNWDLSYDFANLLISIKEYTHYFKHFQFVRAMSIVSQYSRYDNDVFLEQLSKINADNVFNGVANVSNFKEKIIEVYNYRLRNDKRLV